MKEKNNPVTLGLVFHFSDENRICRWQQAFKTNLISVRLSLFISDRTSIHVIKKWDSESEFYWQISKNLKKKN